MRQVQTEQVRTAQRRRGAPAELAPKAKAPSLDASAIAHQYWLETEERESIEELLDDLLPEYGAAESEQFLDWAPVLAHELPAGVKRFLNDVRLDESAGVILIRANAIDAEAIGPTPPHWTEARTPETIRYEMLLVLYGSLLGDVFGWATQRDGQIVHDVLPVQGDEGTQLGTSSTVELTYHTEEAFHPYCADYVGLLCLRNPARAATMIGAVDDAEVRAEIGEVLRQPRFLIRPDSSHLPEHNNAGWAGDEGEDVFRAVDELLRSPQPVPVLYGHPAAPTLRIDPQFMDVVDGDHEAAQAFSQFQEALEGELQDLVLQEGDVCFIDNLRVVHGRRAFAARYDGSDRWLKRINVTRDLRKSRSMRRSSRSRVIG